MALYDDVIELGIEHSNHESDLYLPVNQQTTKLIEKYYGKNSACVQCFTHTQHKTRWYDVAFAYLPYWENKLTLGK